MSDQIPNVRLNNYNSMPGMFRQVLKEFLMGVDDMLPARVLSYNRTTNLAQVQPMIKIIKTDNSIHSRAAIAAVPVLQIGGGGFMLNFNVSPGDLGFIKANDRDISLFMQSFQAEKPNTYRKHSFSDAIFIPAPLTGMTIDGEDESHVVLSTLDGTQRVSIWPDRVKITSSNRVIIDSPITEITGELVTGTNSEYTQTVTMNGSLSATGDIRSDSGGKNVSLNNHIHSGVQTGGGNTGQPV